MKITRSDVGWLMIWGPVGLVALWALYQEAMLGWVILFVAWGIVAVILIVHDDGEGA